MTGKPEDRPSIRGFQGVLESQMPCRLLGTDLLGAHPDYFRTADIRGVNDFAG
jgi:hypothetical protein